MTQALYGFMKGRSPDDGPYEKGIMCTLREEGMKSRNEISVGKINPERTGTINFNVRGKEEVQK